MENTKLLMVINGNTLNEMKDDIRKELHKLLDQMLDRQEEIGNICQMTTIEPLGYHIENIRVIIQRREYDI